MMAAKQSSWVVPQAADSYDAVQGTAVGRCTSAAVQLLW
jgi:hypothetical protein